ncbi:MAG: hypothetical protein U0414_30630 [Polyangiaceae bacterium]
MAARRSLLTLLTTALVVGLAAHTAQAQPEAPDAGTRAIAIGSEGKGFYEQGRFGDALAKFREADAIVHSPVFTLYIARTERRMGKLLEARADYAKILAEVLAKDDPDPWVAAHRDATTELAQIEPLIPHVTLTLERPSVAPATLDDQPVRWGERTEINPGAHVVRIASIAPYEQKFTVDEGKDETVVVRPPEPLAPAVPDPRRPARREPVVVPAQPGSLVPGAVVLGVGLGALTVGGIFSGIALAARGDVDPSCLEAPGCTGQVRQDSSDANDRAGLFGNTSTGLFIGGGIASAIGVALLVVRPGGTPETTTPVALVVSPGWMGVRGAF